MQIKYGYAIRISLFEIDRDKTPKSAIFANATKMQKSTKTLYVVFRKNVSHFILLFSLDISNESATMKKQFFKKGFHLC